jgi:hypothetical protein
MMKQNLRLAGLLMLAVTATASAADKDKLDAGKDQADLVKALQAAENMFTAKVRKVEPLGQTNSIPASIFGKVTLKDLKPLSGALPKAATFSSSYREGMTQLMDLMASGEVLVGVKKEGVSMVVAATEANLAIAKRVLATKDK